MKKRKIILYFPGLQETITFGFSKVIPYTLLYLERAIRHFDLDIILIDHQINNNFEQIIEPIKDDLFFVGISTMTGYQLKGAIEFSKYIRSISDVEICWGGWHPSILPEQVLKEDYVDYVITGQGETPLREFIENKLNNMAVNDISGLGYKHNGKIIINSRDKYKDPTCLGGDIDFSLIDINSYASKRLADGKKSLTYLCSHGCPYRCGFCSQAVIYNRRWYGVGIEKIVDDLRYFKTAGVDVVYFGDANFFTNRAFVLEICSRIINEKLDIEWSAQAHVNTFLRQYSDADIKKIKESGCTLIAIGAESGDQQVLDVIAKQSTVEDNLKIVKVLAEHDIIPHFYTIVCFPMNPERDFDLTINMIGKAQFINPKLRSSINFYTPYPGTDLYDIACKNGFKHLETTEEWSNHLITQANIPWQKIEYQSKVSDIMAFYLPMANPEFANIVPPKFKLLAKILLALFHKKACKRFRDNNFDKRFEALIFLKTLSLFNRIFRTQFYIGRPSR